MLLTHNLQYALALWFSFGVALAISVGCGSQPPETDLSDHPSLAASLKTAKGAGELHLYEGLSHQYFEPEQLQEEVDSYETIQIGDYTFFAAPVAPDTAPVEAIVRLLSDPNSIRPIKLDEAKACGGFHPDYGLRWDDGDQTYFALVCFGCGELRMAGGVLELHAEFAGDAGKRLRSLLKTCESQRMEKQEL